MQVKRVNKCELVKNSIRFCPSLVPYQYLLDSVFSFCLQSQSYAMTDGQDASLSWNKAPIWGLQPDFYYCQTVAGLLMWGALSDERTVVIYTAVILGSQSMKLCDHISLSQIRDFPFHRLL
jgi:hypothetical protein